MKRCSAKTAVLFEMDRQQQGGYGSIVWEAEGDSGSTLLVESDWFCTAYGRLICH